MGIRKFHNFINLNTDGEGAMIREPNIPRKPFHEGPKSKIGFRCQCIDMRHYIMRTMASAISSRFPAMQAIGRMGTTVLQPPSAVASSLQGNGNKLQTETSQNHIDIMLTYLISAVIYSVFFFWFDQA